MAARKLQQRPDRRNYSDIFVFCACLIFVVVNGVGFAVIGNNAPKVGGLSVLLLGSAFLLINKRRMMMISAPWLLLTVVIATLNIYASGYPIETFQRWFFWIAVLNLLAAHARYMSPASFRRQIELASYFFLAVFVANVLRARFGGLDERDFIRAMHLSGTYALFAIVFAGVARSRLESVVLIVVGIVGVYFSGSRGALVGVPFALIPIVWRASVGVKLVFLVVSFGLMVYGASSLGGAWEDFNKTKGGEQGLSEFSASFEDRIVRATIALRYSYEEPYGIGLGVRYDELIGLEKGGHAHNGYVHSLLELGWFGFIVGALIGIRLLFELIRSKKISSELRLVYGVFVLTYGVRAMSESYTVFDLGSFANYFFLWLTLRLMFNANGRKGKFPGDYSRVSRRRRIAKGGAVARG